MNEFELTKQYFERKIPQWQRKKVLYLKNGKIEQNDNHEYVKLLSPEERKEIFDEYKKLSIELNDQDIECLNRHFWITIRNHLNVIIAKIIIEEVLESARLDVEEIFDKNDHKSLTLSLFDAIANAKKQGRNIKEAVKESLIEWLQKRLNTDEKDLATLASMAEKLRLRAHKGV